MQNLKGKRMQSLVCNGVIDLTATPPTCPVAWQAVETALGFDIAQLDGGSLTSAFLAGFGLLFLPMALVWASRVVLSMLR